MPPLTTGEAAKAPKVLCASLGTSQARLSCGAVAFVIGPSTKRELARSTPGKAGSLATPESPPPEPSFSPGSDLVVSASFAGGFASGSGSEEDDVPPPPQPT